MVLKVGMKESENEKDFFVLLRQAQKAVRLSAGRHVGQTNTELRAHVGADRTTANQSATSAGRNSQRAAAITNNVESKRRANQRAQKTGNQSSRCRKRQSVVGSRQSVVEGASHNLSNSGSGVGRSC